MPRRFDKQVFSASTTGSSTVIGVSDLAQADEIGVYVVFGAGVSAGVCVVESSYSPTYAGTWATIATVSWAAASKVHHVAITGVHRALRLRWTTNVADGTADAYVIGKG